MTTIGHMGRPKIFEGFVGTSVSQEVLNGLDALQQRLSKQTGTRLSRAQVIRVVLEKGLDLTQD